MNPIPLFSFAETQRIARVVGFTPDKPGPARDFLLDNTYPPMPKGITGRQRYQAIFYVALGWWIYTRFAEKGRRLPPDVRGWYEQNTALEHTGEFFATGVFQ